jgi:shikimate dehydrogenase
VVRGTASTRVVALLGHPVAHSVSPQIHNAAFAAAGIDAVYAAFDIVPERIDDAVDAIATLGLLGANVTVPHKRAAFLRVPRRAQAAELTGAANTIYWDGDALAVDNTDVAGLGTVLRDLGVGADPVLLLGAGGVARAAAVALGEVGAQVEVVARREAAAVEIRAIAAAAGAECSPVEQPRLVINATPLGLQGETLPDRFMDLEPGQIALDLVYGSSDTPFLAAARAAGATVADGRGMLLSQAAAAFERWTGVAAPRDVMASAMEEALGKTD